MNIYVSTTGSDSTGDGSQSNPYRTIEKALSVASDGDTVIINPGTYYENGKLLSDKNLVIKSSTNNYEDVIIYCSPVAGHVFSGWIVLQNTSDKTLKIQHLTLKMQSVNSPQYYCGFITADDVNHNSTIICNHVFFDGRNINFPVTEYQYAAILSYNIDYIKTYKCTFRYFTKTGENRAAIAVYYYGSALGIESKDCIFNQCDIGIKNNKVGTAVSVDSDYNCYYQVTTNISNGSLGTHDITSDPEFISSDSAEINTSSPCVDSGIIITGYVETYKGSAPDIGAHECVLALISGHVYLNGNPISGAIIRFYDNTDGSYKGSTTSDSSGYYEFDDVAQNHKYHVFVEYTDSTTGDKFNDYSKWDISPKSLI